MTWNEIIIKSKKRTNRSPPFPKPVDFNIL